MPLSLIRVDERLIHGQVVLGWGSQLQPDRYLVVDDDVASSEWEQELYALGAGETEVVFVDVAQARSSLPAWDAAALRSVLLLRDLDHLERLAAGGGLAGVAVNLGGLHHGPGRREVLTYLHLSEEDEAVLTRLSEQGVEISAQDLPDASRVSLRSLLGA